MKQQQRVTAHYSKPQTSPRKALVPASSDLSGFEVAGLLREKNCKPEQLASVLQHGLRLDSAWVLDFVVRGEGLSGAAVYLRSFATLNSSKAQLLAGLRVICPLVSVSEKMARLPRLLRSIVWTLKTKETPVVLLALDLLREVLHVDSNVFLSEVLQFLQKVSWSSSVFAPLMALLWEDGAGSVRRVVLDLLFELLRGSEEALRSRMLMELSLLHFRKSLPEESVRFFALEASTRSPTSQLKVTCDPSTSLNATFKMRYDESTTISDVLEYVEGRLQHSTGLKMDECGVYFPGLNNQSGVWALRTDLVNNFHPVECSFSISPIPLMVVSPTGGVETLMVDVTWDVARLHEALTARYVENEAKYDSYRVMLLRKGEHPVWLARQVVLSAIYAQLKGEGTQLALHQPPSEVDVQVVGVGLVTVPLHLEQTSREFIAIVADAAKVSLTEEHALSSDGDWVEPEDNLASAGISRDTQLKLDLRPRPIIVGERELMFVFNDPVGNLLQMLDLEESEMYVLKHEPQSNYIIYPWEGLKRQHVQYGDTLHLVRRELDPRKVYQDAIQDLSLQEDEHIDEDLIMDGDQIEGASLHALVKRLTNITCPLSVVKTTILTYRSFTTGIELVKLLIQICIDPETPAILMRVATVLKHWITIDINIESGVLDCICFMAEQVFGHSNSFNATLGVVRTAVIRAAYGDGRSYKLLSKAPNPMLPKSLMGGTKTQQLKYSSISALEIARQLTIPVAREYRAIKSEEFFQTPWAKERTQYKAPHIMCLIESYNRTAQWVATSIVMETTLRKRVKMMQHQLAVCHELRKLQNYHVLSAFLSGFSNASVNRLKWTKEGLNKKSQRILEECGELTNMQSSFKALRAALLEGVPPKVPYLGVFLADFTFIEDGNPDTLSHKRADGESIELINFGKRSLFSSSLDQIQQYQIVPYNLTEVPVLQDYLSGRPVLDDKQLYNESLEREPRDAEKNEIE